MNKQNPKLKTLFKKLNTPWKIQEYISKLPYNPEDYCRSAEKVFVDQKAHCLEGALLACIALENLGHPPSLLHFRTHRDDDHVVAVFKEKTGWGAIGKSNTTLLRWRPSLYQNPESLLMSYFPFYFNTKGQLSLIAWAGPIPLKRYEHWNWRNGEGDISDMGASFYDTEKSKTIMSSREIEKLPKANPELVKACFLGANLKGLYQV